MRDRLGILGDMLAIVRATRALGEPPSIRLPAASIRGTDLFAHPGATASSCAAGPPRAGFF